MFAFETFPGLSPQYAMWIDAGLLSVVSALVIYLFVLKPAKVHDHLQTETLIQAMSEGLVIQDHNGTIIECNQAALEILGLTHDQLSGRTSLDPEWKCIRADGKPFPGNEHPSMVSLRTGKPLRGTLMGVQTPDQKLRWIQINAVPFEKQVVCTFTDITALRESTIAAHTMNERLTTAVAAMRFGVWDWNLKTGDLVWDPYMFEIFSIPSESFSGNFDAFEKTLIPEDLLSLKTFLDGVFRRSETEFETEFRVRRKDGQIRLISAKAFCFYDTDGKVARSIGCNWDITDSRTLEREKEQTQSLLAQIVDSTPDWIFIKDLQHRYIKVNDAYAGALQMRPEQVIGKNDLELGFPEELVKGNAERGIVGFWPADQAVIDSGETHIIENDPAMLRGKMHIFHTIKTPIRDEAGKIYGVLGFSRDITLIRSAQETLIQSSKMASLGEMSAGIAHEINNPLTIIMGNASQILGRLGSAQWDEARARQSLEKILVTVERIAKIVRGLRTFSRNADNDPMVPCILPELLRETLDLCSERFKHHGIELQIQELPYAHLLARPSQLSQVLLNLLNNAHDAVESLSEKWIRVEGRLTADGSVEVSVTDSGSGIPKPLLDKLMQPFFTTKPVGKGTGLGLSIASGIVADHGGKLAYDPISPRTRFVLTLPLARQIPEKSPLSSDLLAPDTPKKSA